MADLYEILQVHPRADPEVIRVAFRALARKHHPDAGGDINRMMELNNAWDVLGNPRRRAAYDAVRNPLNHAPGPRPAQPSSQFAAATERPSYESRPAAPTAPPPPGMNRAGTVLDFGRYAGWSVGQLAGHDPDYLQWLERTPIGRPLRAEIETYLSRRSATATAERPAARHERRRRF